MELKKALTIKEQIERLKTAHNLVIDNDDEAAKILRTVNYYRLSAYGIGLTKKNNREEYIDGTSLTDIYRLYEFDSSLRNLILKLIEYQEIRLRTLISCFLALKYGAEGYIDPANFLQVSDKQGNDIHKSIIDAFKEETIRQKNLPFVKHHEQKYSGHYPIWVAIELFSFGKLSSLYSIMRNSDRNEIAKQYRTKPDYLKSWIICLLEVRNICAHYNRLYNMPLKQAPYLYPENIPYRKGKQNKLFPVLITLKRMTASDNDPLWNDFVGQLSSLMKKYRDVVNLSFIGFPKNWKDVLS